MIFEPTCCYCDCALLDAWRIYRKFLCFIVFWEYYMRGLLSEVLLGLGS